MNSLEYVGFTAGLFVSVSVLPQIIKSWKTKSTKDISIYWNAINLIGQLLWIIYGVGTSSISLIVMSSVSFLMNFSMIVLKMRFG